MIFKTTAATLVFGLALAVPVAAQDEPPAKEPTPVETKPASADKAPKARLGEPPLHRWGGWTVSVAGWSPSLIGANEDVAMSYSADASLDGPNGVSGTGRTLDQLSKARIKEVVEVAYHLPRNLGTLVAHYDSMSARDHYQNFTPGNRNFLETRIYPFAAGAFDDGRADGVQSEALRRTREFRLDYRNLAFESRWVRATWSVGFRELSHERALGITYYTLVPNLPPAIPPGTDPLDHAKELARLAPLPDYMSQTSDYTGHGLGASLDVEFTLHPRVSLITGLSVGLIRGTSQGAYASATSYYNLASSPNTALTKDQLFAIIENGCTNDPVNRPDCVAQPGGPPRPAYISDILQTNVNVGVAAAPRSQLGQTYDVYFGLKVIAYKGLSVFVTARDVSYINVGQYVVPQKAVDSSQTPLGTQTTNLNAGYEGYEVGLSWRF